MAAVWFASPYLFGRGQEPAPKSEPNKPAVKAEDKRPQVEEPKTSLR